MIDLEKHKRIDLKIGEVHISKEPEMVWTILGSCVAVVFHNKRLKTGGICHARLPEENSRGPKCSDACPIKCLKEVPDSNQFIYVTCSIRYLLKRFLQLGIKQNEIDVKIFGGAAVLPYSEKLKPIGEQNIEAALRMIEELSLNLVSQNTGGKRGRTLYFNTETGIVFVRSHKHSQSQ